MGWNKGNEKVRSPAPNLFQANEYGFRPTSTSVKQNDRDVSP
jgi:hypothetical protein